MNEDQVNNKLCEILALRKATLKFVKNHNTKKKLERVCLVLGLLYIIQQVAFNFILLCNNYVSWATEIVSVYVILICSYQSSIHGAKSILFCQFCKERKI